MIYDLMVVARLKENAKQLKKLFRGLDRDFREIHYGPILKERRSGRDLGQPRNVGACNGCHHWADAKFSKDWWQVTCLACVQTHFSMWKRGEGSSAA